MAARGGAARAKLPRTNIAVVVLFILLAMGFYHLPHLPYRRPHTPLANAAIAVDVRTFTAAAAEASSTTPLFEFDDHVDTFSVLQAHPPFVPGSPQLYTLVAHLVGPLNLFFSCWLLQGHNGSYACPEVSGLDIGTYRVEVVLLRAPAASPPPACTTAAQTLLSSGKGPTFPVLDFITAGGFKRFEEYQGCFQYPAVAVVDTSWTKPIRKIPTSSSWKMRAIYEAPPCEGAGGRGRWVPGGGLCPGSGSCSGVPFEPVELQDLNLVVIDMQHIFLPFTCVPRFLSTPTEGARCVADSKIVFAGDARLAELAASSEPWLGGTNGPVPFLSDFDKDSKGLAAAMAGKGGDALRQALRSGRAVVMNTMLNDFTDAKKDALDGFFAGIAALRKELEAAAADAEQQGQPPPRLFWVSLTQRAPQAGAPQPGGWQTPDILWELEDHAAAELEAAGARRIDLRWMMSAAPARWWTPDGAHWASTELILSFFGHVTLQTILIEVCPPPPAEDAGPSFLTNQESP